MNPFVIILIILDICAAIWFLKKGDLALMWYWISAASITMSTIYLKGH